MLVISIYADSVRREPVHIGLVKGCAFGILANLNGHSIKTIRDKCTECIVDSPIRKSNELANLLVNDCVIEISKKIK